MATFNISVSGTDKFPVGQVVKLFTTTDSSRPPETNVAPTLYPWVTDTGVTATVDAAGQLAFSNLVELTDYIIGAQVGGVWRYRMIGRHSLTAAAAGGSRGQGFQSGRWYSSEHYNSGTITFNTARMAAVPLWVGEAVTLDRIALEVTTVGLAGTLIRLGIYRDGTGHYPGALLLDAGTVVGDALGAQAATINQALAAGLYWLAAACQGTAAGNPVVRSINGNATASYASPMGRPSALGAINEELGYIDGAGHGSGALPDPFTAAVATSSQLPFICVRAV
jgi:hypothetical protein